MNILANVSDEVISRLGVFASKWTFGVRGVLNALLFVAMSATQALGAQSLAGQENKSPVARLKLAGVVQLAGKIYAAIPDEIVSDLAGRWWSVGDYLAECHVKQITADSVVLTARRTGREITLHLARSGVSEAMEPGKRRKVWINSAENPMCYRPFPLPPEVSGAWPGLSEEEKNHVVAVYCDYGWNLVVTESPTGGRHFGWQSIYAAERRAAMAQARVDFENSLNPEQRAIYAKIKATFPEVRGGGNAMESREQIEADSQVRGTEWPKLRATLSPSQRELDEAKSNPFKAIQRMP